MRGPLLAREREAAQRSGRAPRPRSTTSRRTPVQRLHCCCRSARATRPGRCTERGLTAVDPVSRHPYAEHRPAPSAPIHAIDDPGRHHGRTRRPSCPGSSHGSPWAPVLRRSADTVGGRAVRSAEPVLLAVTSSGRAGRRTPASTRGSSGGAACPALYGSGAVGWRPPSAAAAAAGRPRRLSGGGGCRPAAAGGGGAGGPNPTAAAASRAAAVAVAPARRWSPYGGGCGQPGGRRRLPPGGGEVLRQSGPVAGPGRRTVPRRDVVARRRRRSGRTTPAPTGTRAARSTIAIVDAMIQPSGPTKPSEEQRRQHDAPRHRQRDPRGPVASQHDTRRARAEVTLSTAQHHDRDLDPRRRMSVDTAGRPRRAVEHRRS